MDNQQTTQSLHSMPENQKTEPASFWSSASDRIKAELEQIKDTVSGRYKMAAGIIGNTPKGNFFKNAYVTLPKALAGVVDVSGKQDWKNIIGQIKRKANENRGTVTANSTPEIYPETKKKMEMASKYKYKEEVLPSLWGVKVKDTSPDIIDDNTIRMNRLGAGYEYGGKYNKYTDKIEIARLASGEEETLSHEFLHKLFRDGLTDASKDYQTFNRLWENALAGTQDKEAKRILSSIETKLRTDKLYEGLDDYTFANERFAYLGEEIGKRGYKGKALNNLLKYYNQIFK